MLNDHVRPRSIATGTPYGVQIGSSDDGEDVKIIQQALVKAGQKVEVDGKYGG